MYSDLRFVESSNELLAAAIQPRTDTRLSLARSTIKGLPLILSVSNLASYYTVQRLRKNKKSAMWSKKQPQGRNPKIALQLQHIPISGRIKLAINNTVVSEESFENRNARKMIMLNWEEKYSLYEKEYTITIAC